MPSREIRTLVYVEKWWEYLNSFTIDKNLFSNSIGFVFVSVNLYLGFISSQSRHPSQGARQDTPQEPSSIGIGMARNRRSTKSRMATLCYSPVSPKGQNRCDRQKPMHSYHKQRSYLFLFVFAINSKPGTPHSSFPSSSRNRSSERTSRSRNGAQGPGRIPSAVQPQINKPYKYNHGKTKHQWRN